MFDEKTLKNFCSLVLKLGVNLQKGQGVELICPVERKDLALVFTERAYQLGASIVRVRWEDEEIDKISYQYAETDVLKKVPKWVVMQREYLVENNFCYVAIASENPTLFNDVDPKKLAEISSAKSKALKKFSDTVMSNGIRWCVVSVPTKEWAKQVFPKSDNPESDLLDAIVKTMRLNEDDPVSAWNNHVENLIRRANILNEYNFSHLLYSSKNGTNLKIGLAKNHKWLSAMEKSRDGINFIANMPTEEVFTAPHKNMVDGRLCSSMPLCYQGQIIDEFTIDFKKGKIVGYTAKSGYETLKGLIETDNGTSYLGEVALIGKSSPITQLKTLFYNTLFDENASSHLAIGKGYPTTIINGENLTKKELSALGLNDSVEHVDFMIGTDDLSVIGVTCDGRKITLFDNGDWMI